MKRKISEMLDSCGDSVMDLACDAPLSPERIKELTMNKITNKKERKSRRGAFRVLVAVAIIASLTATVFAAGSITGWFEEFLGTIFVPESWKDASTMEDYSMELLAEPVSGIPAYQFDGDGVIDVTVVSARLRPDSLMLFYRATDFGSTFDHYPGSVKAVLLDGTERNLDPSGFGRTEDSDSLDWAEYASDVPAVDEIDYIELPNGTKIKVP